MRPIDPRAAGTMMKAWQPQLARNAVTTTVFGNSSAPRGTSIFRRCCADSYNHIVLYSTLKMWRYEVRECKYIYIGYFLHIGLFGPNAFICFCHFLPFFISKRLIFNMVR